MYPMTGAKRRANIAGERPSREASPRPRIEDADRALFRAAVGDVRPLTHDRHEPARPRAVPRRRTAAAHEAFDPGSLELAPHSESLPESFARPGVRPGALRRLRRGQLGVDAEIDLHGLTAREAHAAVASFRANASRRGLRCVRIIHGKGRHGESGEGILKLRTRHWLTQCPEVLAFCEAPPSHGGGGAVLALLKSGPG